jgi:alanine racemase
MMISKTKLKYNLNLFRRYANGAEIGCVLKSNSYGCGTKIITNFFSSNGIKTFFVATHEEAKDLASILNRNTRIYVLADYWEPIKSLKKTQIISVISRYEDLDKSIKIFKNDSGSLASIHLDCGLNRYGMKDSKILRKSMGMINRENCKNLLVIAHLSHSDSARSHKNYEQLNQLLDFKTEFPDFKYSISGSAAVINDSIFSMDIVRSGLSLFGASSTNSIRMNKFKNVVTLCAPILQIKIINKGEGVGYNHQFISKKKTYVATAKIGYGDGVNRRLANKPIKVYFNGKAFSLIGKISMDLICFEINKEIYEILSKKDIHYQYVEIINDDQSPNDIANNLDTIPHEILTSISSRVKRILVD